MKNLVNIAKDGANPLYVLAEEITGMTVNDAGTELAIYNRKGLLFHCNAAVFNLDIDDVAKKIIDSGTPLVRMHGAEGAACYAAPSAILHLLVHKPAVDGTYALLSGVDGFVPPMHKKVSREQLDEIVAAVQHEKLFPDYLPKGARSGGWGDRVSACYFAPEDVTWIKQSSGSLDLCFGKYGFIDLSTIGQNDARAVYIDVINSILATNKSLKNVSSLDRHVYITMSQVQTMTPHTSNEGKPLLYFRFGQSADNADVQIEYASEAERQLVIDRLTIKRSIPKQPFKFGKKGPA